MTQGKRTIAPMQLDKFKDNEVVIKGRKLNVRWMDSYLLVFSGDEHPYEFDEHNHPFKGRKYNK